MHRLFGFLRRAVARGMGHPADLDQEVTASIPGPSAAAEEEQGGILIVVRDRDTRPKAWDL